MSEDRAEYRTELQHDKQSAGDSSPEAMMQETAERLTIGRSNLIAIAQNMQGEIDVEFLITSSMVLNEIAQTMTMAAHMDLAMQYQAAIDELNTLKAAIVSPHDHADELPRCDHCKRWILGEPIEREDNQTLCIPCERELNTEGAA